MSTVEKLHENQDNASQPVGDPGRRRAGAPVNIEAPNVPTAYRASVLRVKGAADLHGCQLG